MRVPSEWTERAAYRRQKELLEQFGLAVGSMLGRAEFLLAEKPHVGPPPMMHGDGFGSALQGGSLTESQRKDREQWEIWIREIRGAAHELFELVRWFRTSPDAVPHRAVLRELDAWGRELFRQCFRYERQAYWPVLCVTPQGDPLTLIDLLQRGFPLCEERKSQPQPWLFLTE